MRKFLWKLALILTVCIAGSSASVWACKSAGANKHVGNVTTIDSGLKTFTIRDAETDDRMTFEASDSMLRNLRVNDRVMVEFQDDHGKMKAVEVQS